MATDHPSDSETKPLYGPRQINAVICAATESPFKDYYGEITLLKRTESAAVRTSMAEPFPSQPKHGLEVLDRLPTELLFMIYISLDVESCFKLRQVNLSARQVVSSLPQYRALKTHAVDCLQAVFQSGMARNVTGGDLYRVFCDHACMICSIYSPVRRPLNFNSQAGTGKGNARNSSRNKDANQGALPGGADKIPAKNAEAHKNTKASDSGSAAAAARKTGVSSIANEASNVSVADNSDVMDGLFLFLPTMTRCCRSCLEESPRVRAVPFPALKMVSGLGLKDFASVICTPPVKKVGEPSANAAMERTGSVTQEKAVEVLLDLGFSNSRVKEILFQSGYLAEFSWPRDIERERFATVMPFLDRKADKAFRGFACKGCQAAIKRTYRNLKTKITYTKTVYGTESASLEHFSRCPKRLSFGRQFGQRHSSRCRLQQRL